MSFLFVSSGQDKPATRESAMGRLPHTAVTVHLWWKDRQRIRPGVLTVCSLLFLTC